MGAYQNNPQRAGRGKKSRGSVKNKSRLDAFAQVNNGSGDWGVVEAKLVLAVVEGITSKGGAVTFGLSRDGGGHMLKLMLEGYSETLWFNGDADLGVSLEGVIDTLDGMA